MTAPTANPRIAAGRYASRARNSHFLSHLLYTSWPDDGRKTRPALCGERRVTWHNLDVLDNAEAFDHCQRCDDVAADLPGPTTPVRIAVVDAPRGDVVAPPTAVVENTQAARVARRRAFRRLFDLAPEARGYVPQPYRNQFTSTPAQVVDHDAAGEWGDDLTEELLDVIEGHQNGERAGAASTDPS